MTWFGRNWRAPVCREEPQVATPVGEPCLWCGEPIDAGDDGMMMPHYGVAGQTRKPLHLDCQIRSVVGGLNHILRRCICCGGTMPPDPPDISMRAAARLAAEAYRRRTPMA